ncbi:MAG: DNA polymerase III subunit alpha [Desulfobacterota bacterium]|nr:DNA polymerase III subunit alpha [Thermodesulfobacteriota bacterium]
MSTADFIHLHLHSQYSLLDGAIRFEEVFELARAYGMDALALTDHGNLFGAIEFYQMALRYGIKPIIGCEVYVAPGSRFEKKSGVNGGESAYHLTLLVKNRTGYFNLIRLVSLAHLEGFYYKPRVDKELLRRYQEGLICLSGCLKGEIPLLLKRGEMDRALQVAEEYRTIFEGRRFFLEIMRNGVEGQAKVNERLLEVGRELFIPVVATNDCHYLRREDARAHEVLLCIQTGKTLDDRDRMRFASDEFYFRSGQEMTELFRDIPEAIAHTLEIAEACNLELKFEERHIPQISIPSGESPDQHLERMAREGLERRLQGFRHLENFDQRAARYRSRLEEELKIIQSMGYTGYFLIVADFIHYAKQRGIPVGPGRGSVAGSLVAYALQITDLDPLEYDLIFERFLNPGRKTSMPDVDVDFCMERRDEVIRYVAEKYGKENVAQIITFGKMQARAVIRDVGRVLGIPYAEVDRIAKLIPPGPNITLEEALQREPQLNELMEQDPRISNLFQIARSLEGLTRHASTHAAGVVIANRPLMEYLPLYRDQDGEVVTQYAMKEVEAIGLVKFDFLGLKTLTMLHHTLELIRANRGITIDLSQIPLDDPDVYAALSSGSNLGIFQLESSGMRDLLMKLKPESFKDIIALLALYRPGPLDSGMVEEFVKRKQGKVGITYEVPELEGILKETYGVIVYQEQVMRIASRLANYSLDDADDLRRAMAKKDPAEMERQRKKFLEGAKKNRISQKKAEKIFEQMETFGRYGFNKSHSAAYALIAYQTAYLKTHFPIEFMAALLTSEAQNTDKIVRYIAECREMSIPVLPPDINESQKHFSVVGNQIRFGLAAVKNVGEAAIEVILRERAERGRFQSLQDFCERVDLRKVNRRVIESLIKCGAFDFSKAYRSQMLSVLDALLERVQGFQKRSETHQLSMWDVSRPKGDFSYPDIDEFPPSQLILFEKETIGFYVTRHPLESYQEEIRRWSGEDTSTLPRLQNGQEVKLCGLVSAVKEIMTRKGDRMAFLTLEDMKGTVEVILFPETYKTALSSIKGGEPIMVRGTLDLAEERIKIKALEIFPLQQGMAFPKSVHVKVPYPSLSPQRLTQLKETLLIHRGPARFFLHVVDGDEQETVIEFSEEYGVNPSTPFQDRMGEIFPSCTVSLEGN